jgi:hypothetical protein
MQQNRQEAINRAVEHLFAQYPFVAGQSAPVPPPAKK